MTFSSRWTVGAAALLVVAAAAAGCAMAPKVDYDKVALEMINGSFRPQGQAGIDRLKQDEAQRICSTPSPNAAALKRIETAELATIKPPASGRYRGDWREG